MDLHFKSMSMKREGLQRRTQKADGNPSEHFMDTTLMLIAITATFDHSAWFDSKMGWMEERMYIHTFRDADGNVLIWKTSSNSLPDMESGDQVQIKGTVKEHSEYKDEKQTVLTRCKVTKV